MPAKKGSLDKRNLGRKVLDGAEYVGKNFWKALPIGASIAVRRKEKRERNKLFNEYKELHESYIQELSKEKPNKENLEKIRKEESDLNEKIIKKTISRNSIKQAFKEKACDLYSIVGTGIASLYIVGAALNYSGVDEKIENKIKHVEKVDSVYKAELGKCTSARDSFEFYKNNNLDKYLFEEPSFKDKEKFYNNIKQNSENNQSLYNPKSGNKNNKE